jgi:U-box domain
VFTILLAVINQSPLLQVIQTSMSDLISTIPGIGPLAVGIFNEARYTTIEHLRNFNGDDRQLQEVIDRRKVGSDFPRSYWKRLATRCINIITRVRNARALPVHPDHLICPISLDLMTDPVIAPSGISYDRESIEEWLSYRNTEPSSKETLQSEQLYTNRGLREAIDLYHNNYQQYHI